MTTPIVTAGARRRVDGVLLLDKACGLTANAALQAARRLFAAAKAGHTGTLDPMASGLLPLCLGEATKFAEDLLLADKTYEAELRFGIQTDTGDADGAVVVCAPVAFSLTDLERILPAFHGPLMQVPPMYSALKRDGRPLYQLARKGIEVERAARPVIIREIHLLAYSGDHCRLRVTCSKGTYIRTLAEDLAKALDSVAHLTALRRTRVGSLSVDAASTLDELAQLADDQRLSRLLAPDALLQSLPALTLIDTVACRFVLGSAVDSGVPPGRYRVYGDGQLLGVGVVDAAGTLQPRRVVRAADSTVMPAVQGCA